MRPNLGWGVKHDALGTPIGERFTVNGIPIPRWLWRILFRRYHPQL